MNEEIIYQINNNLDEDVKETQEILEEYHAARMVWEVNAKKSEDFAYGAQLTPEQIKDLEDRRQSPVIVNVILPAVEQAVALLTTNRPRFSSTAREDSDVRTGKVFSDIMTWIWEQSDGNAMLKAVINETYTKGLSYICAYIDPYQDFGKGDIVLQHCPAFNVYVDPNSTDRFFRDAANIIISKVVTEEVLNQMYPNVDTRNMQKAYETRTPASQVKGLEGQTDVYSSQYHNKYEILDRYSKIKVRKYHVYFPQESYEMVLEDDDQYEQWQNMPAVIMQTGGNVRFIVNELEVKQNIEMIQQLGETYHYEINPENQQEPPHPVPGPEVKGQPELVVPNSEVNCQVVNMQYLVEQGIIMVNITMLDRIYRVLSAGNVLIWKGFMGNLSHYPIVPFMFRHKGDPYPPSDVTLVRGLQEYINTLRRLIIAHAANATNVKVIVNTGSIDKDNFITEFAKAGTAVLEADFELGEPKIVTPIPLPTELYKNEVDARRDIQEILGIYAMGQGDTAQAPPTYKGTMALDEFGQRRIKSKKDDIEASLNVLARCVVQMIQMVYTEERVIRLLRPNNIEQSVNINRPIYDDITGSIKGKLNDVTVGQYDVVVVSGSMLPSNRWAQLEYYIDLYAKGIIDREEVLKKTEVVDTEGVLRRIDQIMGLSNQLEQAMQDVEKLNRELESARVEILNLNKRLEIEKFKSELSDNLNKAELATDYYEKSTKKDMEIIREKAKIEAEKERFNRKKMNNRRK